MVASHDWQGCGKEQGTWPIIYLLYRDGHIETHKTGMSAEQWLCGDSRGQTEYSPICVDCLAKLGYIW